MGLGSSQFQEYITPYSQLRVKGLFGKTYRLHLQGRRINGARNQDENRWQVCHRPWRWRWYVRSKRLLAFSWLHIVISQNIGLFITTGVRNSIPVKSVCLCVLSPTRTALTDETEYAAFSHLHSNHGNTTCLLTARAHRCRNKYDSSACSARCLIRTR
jgi:hypothetical protein